jgi:hypothetical protein
MGFNRPEVDFGRPNGLWSLWDMLNLLFGPLYHVLRNLKTQADIARLHHSNLQNDTSSENVADVLDALQKLRKYCDEISLKESVKRIDRIKGKITTSPVKNDFLYQQLADLIEIVEDEGDQQLVFHIEPKKAIQFPESSDTNLWRPSQDSFPSADADMYSATCCYLYDENTACVFHLMRVLEAGLRVLAKAVGLTFDKQNWHNIIEEIESAIERERNTLPKGPERDQRLTFLSAAAKEFFYFKDGWRNHVSHNRSSYDEHQALGAMEHVRAFMNHLSTKLSERP